MSPPRQNPVRKRLLVADADRDPTRVVARRQLKAIFEEAISVPDQRALGATLEDPGQRSGNHIRHLLFHDPTQKNDECSLRIHLETEFRLKRCLAHPLAGYILQIEVGGEMDVGRGIPNPVICPIEDADEIFRTTLQKPFEPATILVSEDLARICGAHGCQAIAVADAGFEERYLAIELEPVRDKAVARKAELGIEVSGKQTLKGEVMHREHCRRPLA
jgi:hypothetical protein